MLPFKRPEKIFHVKEIFEEKIHPPWSIEIQPTNRCNLDCYFCAYRKRKIKNFTQLSVEAFNGLVNSIKKMGIKGVYVSGGGEPLCWNSGEKKISDFINEIAQFTDVALITNGVLLNNHNFESSKNCFYVLFSLYDSRFYEDKSFAPMDDKTLNTVLDNIKRLIKWKKETNSKFPSISIKTLVNKQNYKRLLEIYEELKTLEADHLIFRPAVNYEGDIEPDLSEIERNWVVEQIQKNENKINVKHTDLPYLYNRQKESIMAKKCWIAEGGFYTVIDPSGEVYPCLFYLGDKKYSIGNINETPLNILWGNRRHKDVIRKLNETIKSKKCRICRFMKYNNIIEEYKLEDGYNDSHASFI